MSIAPAAAQTPITIGETHILAYADGEARQVNVYLPEGYAEGEERYPVLYLIDGGLSQDFLHVTGTTALGALWGRSQPVIVVGIETKDRRAELIGTKGNAEEREAFPTAGDSAAFRTWLRDKVKPLVTQTYRTNGTDAVMGESLAGLFIVETWLDEPALFDRYAAINPSLWWQGNALAERAQGAALRGLAPPPLFITYSNEGPETERGVRLVAQAGGDAACLVPTPDLTHATAYHILTPQALQFLFPTDYDFDPELGFEVGCERGKVSE
ncbi:alpha/beta hydrolase [Paraurantiacibacter namhicola]|uniref:alpha/beta hydrolase n=1 Tax=Paraurantiacibacter namhicola TaxID=645517 RepID=UPI001EED05B0|nr:alpha/beta hydrolase-fold protein [Paraurantiacibacter namhicola]